MSRHCLGCGIEMQYNDCKNLGYSPKSDSLYCQRCFRLTNYGEFNIVNVDTLDNNVILEKLNRVDGTILWIVDILDLEASFSKKNFAAFKDKAVIIVISKHDLLPKTMTNERIINYINQRIKNIDFKVRSIILNELKMNNDLLDEIVSNVEVWPVYVVGMANVGKSTFINHLNDNKVLTVSRHPNTTLNFNEIDIKGYKFVDTPGLNQNNSILTKVAGDDLKYVIPVSQLKPKIYQVYEAQSFAIGGLLKLDIMTKQSISIVFYISEPLLIHRGKLDTSHNLWLEHYGTLLTPRASVNYQEYDTIRFSCKKETLEIAINGLGWVKIEGKFDNLEIKCPKFVNVKERMGFESC